MAPTVSIWLGRAVGTRSRTHGSARVSESLFPPVEHGLNNLCPSRHQRLHTRFVASSTRLETRIRQPTVGSVVKVVDRKASMHSCMQTYSQAEVSERKGANKHRRKSPQNTKNGIGSASYGMVLSPRICPFDRAHTRMHALHH